MNSKCPKSPTGEHQYVRGVCIWCGKRLTEEHAPEKEVFVSVMKGAEARGLIKTPEEMRRISGMSPEQLKKYRWEMMEGQVKDCFVFCYDREDEADECYEAIVKAEPPKPVRVVRGNLLTGVPYPYCVWVFFNPEHGDEVDEWLVDVSRPSAPDVYTGVPRTVEYREYLRKGLVRIKKEEELGSPSSSHSSPIRIEYDYRKMTDDQLVEKLISCLEDMLSTWQYEYKSGYDEALDIAEELVRRHPEEFKGVTLKIKGYASDVRELLSHLKEMKKHGKTASKGSFKTQRVEVSFGSPREGRIYTGARYVEFPVFVNGKELKKSCATIRHMILGMLYAKNPHYYEKSRVTWELSYFGNLFDELNEVLGVNLTMKQWLDLDFWVPPRPAGSPLYMYHWIGFKGTKQEAFNHYKTKLEDILRKAVSGKKPERTYQDPMLGRCEYTFFYVINDLYGGWSASCEHGTDRAEYVKVEEVIDKAEKAGMPVSLAGGRWRAVGHEGFGEKVSASEARKLVEQLRRKT